MSTDLVQAIQNLCDRADEATDGVKEAIAATRADITAGTCRDPAKAAQHLAIAAGIMIDKASKLAFEGLAVPQIEDPRTSAQIVAELNKKLGITDEEIERHRALSRQMETERRAALPTTALTTT